MDPSIQQRVRALPSVHRMLSHPAVADLKAQRGHATVAQGARAVLDRTRRRLVSGEASVPELDALVVELGAWLARERRGTLRPVINATGVLIHTNLGRSPLSAHALDAIRTIGAGYSNLEFNLDTGARSDRYGHGRERLKTLTGAEDALVVNNNAAALLLMLSATCQDREVLISRGQLVEIGGGFRIPDILAQSGARLREVGTTNRTYAADYAQAINQNTAAILHVHASNFRQLGYVHQPTLTELRQVADDAARRGARVALFHDLGSGLLDSTMMDAVPESTVRQSVAAGTHLTAFSADKLLGGPQAGVIVGQASLVGHLRQHPLMRALRVDKLVLAALSATLELYASERAATEIPLQVLSRRSLAELRARAGRLVSSMREAGIAAAVEDSEAAAGGGSLPEHALPSVAVALSVSHPRTWLARLRQANPPVVARIERNRVWLDLRTVFPSEDALVLRASREIVADD